ncbi:7329_t:CDS:1 [Acaulospora morrowiae]|uniref:7329_t:CDS:1 n=1 Tax=Acaulospora morrowiae TaxID=94023 RepID=A0A9N8VWH0_9GLOM|nr:7329_t:CDS:1 [Acaulospora morrowiae]
MKLSSTQQKSIQPFNIESSCTEVDITNTLVVPVITSPTRSPVIEVLTTPELIHAIFDYLSVPQLVNVRSVCKQWYQIVNIPSRVAAYVNYTARPKHKKVYVLTNSTYTHEDNFVSDVDVAISGVYTNKRKAQNELNKWYEQYEEQMYENCEDQSDVRIILKGFERKGYYDYDIEQGEIREIGEYDLDDGKESDDETENQQESKAAELESVEEGGITYYLID